jgi:DNA-binding HxlR family transcriptional regulator
MSLEAAYLRAILAMLARQAIPPDELRKIVAPRGDGAKQVKAYNLCDGRTAQSEVSKQSGIDPSNLSKTLARWEAAGIIVRAENPVHVYALPED